VVFSLGLVLVVVAGAELFTGNNLIVMAWADRRIPLGRLLRNWSIVYLGNIAGALATALLVFAARQHEFGGGAVGLNALEIAEHKASLGWGQAVALGVLCNGLVCLAVWLSYAARSVTDKVLAVLFPISAFVAAGFEHSVANMYFLPFGLLVKEEGGHPGDGGPAVGRPAHPESGHFEGVMSAFRLRISADIARRASGERCARTASSPSSRRTSSLALSSDPRQSATWACASVPASFMASRVCSIALSMPERTSPPARSRALPSSSSAPCRYSAGE
jgi:formate/nitrite transporter